MAARVEGEIECRASYCPRRMVRDAAMRRERLLQASRMTKRFRERTFANFRPRKGTEAALDACRAFVGGYPEAKGIVLVGPVGAGKTHLVAACANELLDRGVGVVFTVMADLLADMRAAVGTDSLEDVVAEVRECEVLCLDDIGAERVTDFAREQFYRLVNYRYEQELPILATTNLGPGELEEALGARIVSRLAEMCEWVELDAADYRLKAVRRSD